MRWWQIKKRDADLERELQLAIELEEEELRENGLSAEEARYEARRAFGNTTLFRSPPPSVSTATLRQPAASCPCPSIGST